MSVMWKTQEVIHSINSLSHRQMFVFPTNLYVEDLTHIVMVFGSGTFGK